MDIKILYLLMLKKLLKHSILVDPQSKSPVLLKKNIISGVMRVFSVKKLLFKFLILTFDILETFSWNEYLFKHM